MLVQLSVDQLTLIIGKAKCKSKFCLQSSVAFVGGVGVALVVGVASVAFTMLFVD